MRTGRHRAVLAHLCPCLPFVLGGFVSASSTSPLRGWPQAPPATHTGSSEDWEGFRLWCKMILCETIMTEHDRVLARSRYLWHLRQISFNLQTLINTCWWQSATAAPQQQALGYLVKSPWCQGGRSDVPSASQFTEEVSSLLMPTLSKKPKILRVTLLRILPKKSSAGWKLWELDSHQKAFFKIILNQKFALWGRFSEQGPKLSSLNGFPVDLPSLNCTGNLWSWAPSLEASRPMEWWGLELLQPLKVQEMRTEAKSTSNKIMHTIAC